MAHDYDVIVIGGGGAGLTAALTVAEKGGYSLLVEAGKRVGGSTALSTGVVYAGGTSVQRDAGISDSGDAMYRYYMVLTQFELNPGLIRRYCDESGPAVEWLIQLGVSFPEEKLYCGGLDGVRRSHMAEGEGQAIVDVLDRHASQNPLIDIALGTRVSDLIVEDGSVRGIVANGDRISSGAVIIASGGFGGSSGMVAKLLPETARYGEWLWYIGSPLCRGDGIAMAQSAGAQLTGHDTVTPLLTPGFSKDFEPFVPGWFLFVDHGGRRFTDETLSYPVSGKMLRGLPGGECFAIFDEDSRLARQPVETLISQTFPTRSWDADLLERKADEGKIFREDSLDALAEAAGIDRVALNITVREYNEDVELGEDRSFHKDPRMLRAVRKPPFYAVRMKPAVIGVTGAGIQVDRDTNVLAPTGEKIPGLFAAGEAVGGIMGSCYVGGGGSLAAAFGLGRVSGRSAVDYIHRNSAHADGGELVG